MKHFVEQLHMALLWGRIVVNVREFHSAAEWSPCKNVYKV